MELISRDERCRIASSERSELEQYQLARLRKLFAAILPANGFYQEKLADLALPPATMAELACLPFTYKEELVSGRRDDQLCRNQTHPTGQYVRYHQTSGTRGRPMAVVDTAADWRWWMNCWQYVLDAAGIEAGDRVFMAFSFGPFVGFWSAHDASIQRGCLVVPGGGMSTLGRLEMLRNVRANAVFCTPSYALHLAETGVAHQLDVRTLGVKVIVLAGEPGGSIPATRALIENSWQAAVLDHAGASEVGPWGYGDPAGQGLYINESEFVAEFLSVAHGGPAAEGELAELVLTNLGRYGCPIVRYRTGDLVKATFDHGGPCRFVFLPGGILGRTDDMLVIRGVNVFPSALEHIIRGFPEVIEFRVTAYKQGAMDALRVAIEDRLDEPRRVADELRMRLGLKIDVETVPLGSLPRFEGKGRRFIDERAKPVSPAP